MPQFDLKICCFSTKIFNLFRGGEKNFGKFEIVPGKKSEASSSPSPKQEASFRCDTHELTVTTWHLTPLIIKTNHRLTTNMADATTLRNELLKIIGENPSGHLNPKIVNAFSTKLKAYAEAPGIDYSDVIFAIGSSVYGVEVEVDAKSNKQQKTENSNGPSSAPSEAPVIIGFDYMKQFMKDVFISYGCTEEQAETSSEV